jgi:UDP-4-amino-4,6-dideoxy-N-acetyl-beta-L-altrosamine transaminase
MRNIPYSRQNINKADIAAVMEVLQSPFITQGPAIGQFEESINQYCGSKYALAISSGTAALHLALMALDVGKGDIVWTSPISFVASSNCALYVGATIDFVDSDAKGNMDAGLLSIKLEQAKAKNKLPKVVIAVHYSGRTCDMQAIGKLAKEYGFKVIEDSAHALGARYSSGETVGGNKYCDITMFSFHPVKSITTGEGGVLTTNDKKIADKIALLRSHGITRDADKLQNESHGPWYYEQIDLGYHYRITDIQAALGKSQMLRLDEFIAKRCALAENYSKLLAGLPITVPQADKYSAWHLYVIHVEGARRKQVFEDMRAAGIGVNVHYIPIHMQPYYQDLGFKYQNFPNAEKFYAGAISLPIFPDLTGDEQGYVVDCVSKAINN